MQKPVALLLVGGGYRHTSLNSSKLLEWGLFRLEMDTI